MCSNSEEKASASQGMASMSSIPMYSAQVSFADEVLASVVDHGTSTMKFDDDMDDMDDIEYSAETTPFHERGPSRHNGSRMGGDQSRITLNTENSNSLMDGLEMISRSSHSSDSDSALSSPTSDRSNSMSSPLSLSGSFEEQNIAMTGLVESPGFGTSQLTQSPGVPQVDSVSMLITANKPMEALRSGGPETPEPAPMKHQYSRSALQSDRDILPIAALREKRRKSALTANQRRGSERRVSGVMPVPRLVISKSKSANTPRQSMSISKSNKSAPRTRLSVNHKQSRSRRSVEEALPLNTIVKSQTMHKWQKQKKGKNFKYRSRASLSDSHSSQSSNPMAVVNSMPRSFSARSTEDNDSDLVRRSGSNNSRKGSLSRTKIKMYSSKVDKFSNGHRRDHDRKAKGKGNGKEKKKKHHKHHHHHSNNSKHKKVDSLSSKHFEKKQSYGGGYGVDGPSLMAMDIPTHLRTYYKIQDDLRSLSEATKKPPKKRRLDAISTQLNTLFFANERTNLANMAAFQKFFIDRMSVQSVHKDLEFRFNL